MSKKYVFDTIQGRVAPWLRGHVLFTDKEMSQWKHNGVGAVLLQHKKGYKAYVVQLSDIQQVNVTYWAAKFDSSIFSVDLRDFKLSDIDIQVNRRNASHVQEAIKESRYASATS